MSSPTAALGLAAVLLILLAGHNALQAALEVGIVAVYLVALRQRLTQSRDARA